MRYDQITYYPPFERHSLLLQVTCGCSYNRCAFCNMYKNVEFEVLPLKEILQDLKDAAEYNPYTERVFLVGGEPLCLPSMVEISPNHFVYASPSEVEQYKKEFGL